MRRSLVIVAAVWLLAACKHDPDEWKTPNMTVLTPRLQPVFEKTKTVCFGRFMIDVPAATTVAWGDVSIPLGVSVYPNGVSEVKAMAQTFIDELKSEKAIYLNDIPLLISVAEIPHPEGKIVTGYEGFQAIGELKINGYFKLNDDGVVIDSRPLDNMKDRVTSDIISIAQRLRPRAEHEVPAEPGNCIEHAFLPDKPGTEKERRAELVSIGFRLKEFPDTHLSISIRPSNPHRSESNTLKWQLERLEKNLKAENPNHPRLKTKYFRRGERQIHDWTDGFEGLSRSPDQADIHGIHDFGIDFQGVPHDPLKPFVLILMQTGVANNAAGATKPSLTDEEAIAVWDKITSTIRVRPTGTAAVKTTGTDPQPRLPLGELAATGRICPQTGMWESNEAFGTESSRRRYILAGESMPRVTVLGRPSLWQKLKGEAPSHQLATVWKLVDYNDQRALAIAPVDTPLVAHSHPQDGATKVAEHNNSGDRLRQKTSPEEQG
jgi:hypothetical protein